MGFKRCYPSSCVSHLGEEDKMAELNAVTIKDDAIIRDLIAASHDAKKYAYNEYSKYAVGAALLTTCNRVFTGCNVENASIGLTICAERTAMAKAVSEGFRQFKAIAVAGDDDTRFISPCGACRQFMAEFSLDCEVYMTKPDLSYQKMLVRDLLPYAFGPDCMVIPSTNRDH